MIASASACDPRISVVIPCRDRIGYLKRALKSVFEQTVEPSEIIVVDDGSEKPLQQSISEEFPDVRWIRQSNAGVSSARNSGIREASNDWVAFLDSDDRWKPEKLELQMEFHLEHPRVEISHTDEIWIRNDNQVIPPKYLDKNPQFLFERSLDRCLICPSSVIVHQNLLDRVGNFDESLPVCEDYDLWLRILMKEEFGFIDQPLTFKHGGHTDQLSKSFWGMDRFRTRALEKLLKLNDSASKNKLILQTLIKKYGVLAQGSEKRGKIIEAKTYKEKFQIHSSSLEELVSNQVK